MPAHPLYLFPYHSGSKSAKELSTAMGVPLLRREHSKFVATPAKRVINWGAQTASQVPPNILSAWMINHPSSISQFSNKRAFFQSMVGYNQEHVVGVPVPKAFFSRAEAMQWHLTNPTAQIVARTVLNGHSGIGIYIIETPQDWQNFNENCNLFTVYIRKQSEFRVHFTDFSNIIPGASFNPFFIQRKALPIGTTPISTKVRNLANGYVYVNEEGALVPPAAVDAAVNAFGIWNTSNGGSPRLNFGAIDIIYNKKYNTAYILEVNTAPGLSGLTITKYAEQFKKLET